jgi:hypothetical protein
MPKRLDAWMTLPLDATLKNLVQPHVQDFARVQHSAGPEPAMVLKLDQSTPCVTNGCLVGSMAQTSSSPFPFRPKRMY